LPCRQPLPHFIPSRPVPQGEALRKFAEEAFKEKCRLNPELMARMKKEQDKRDASEYGDEILRQQKEHRKRVRAMREKAQQFRKRNRRDSSSDSDSDDAVDENIRVKATSTGTGVGTGSENKSNVADAPHKPAETNTVVAPNQSAGSSGFRSGGARGTRKGGIRGGGGARRGEGAGDGNKDTAASDSDDGGLARPVLGAKGKGGRKPRFIM
jgi:hypothetical protein